MSVMYTFHRFETFDESGKSKDIEKIGKVKVGKIDARDSSLGCERPRLARSHISVPYYFDHKCQIQLSGLTPSSLSDTASKLKGKS